MPFNPKSVLAAAVLSAAAAPLLAGPDLIPFQTAPLIGPNIGQAPGVADGVDGLRSTQCVDLAVFAHQRRANGGRALITYGVSNVSDVEFVSGAGQQAVVLSKGSAALASEGFSRLAPGQSLTWQRFVRAPMEFPDTYTAALTHGPDLYTDGNPRNDDCNRHNNARQVQVEFG